MKGINNIKDGLRNWIPWKIIYEGGDLLCRWLFTGDLLYADPFFDGTIYRCLIHAENSTHYKCVTTLEMVAEWAGDIDAVCPTAFIFHVSRCGSTLVSQALGMMGNAISLSEVPLFDDILRLPVKRRVVDENQVNELLAGAIRFYGAKRAGDESRLFIKTDSWHLVYYKQLRKLYPDVPFVIMYRQPGAVLESNKRKKGVQGLHQVVQPEVYGFESMPDELLHPDNYMARVLEKLYSCIIEIAANDQLILLLNYNEGLAGMMERIARFTGMSLSASEQAMTEERSKFDAKHPGEKFAEQNMAVMEHPLMRELTGLYEQIEARRVSSLSGDVA